jgi:hypothetical protein
MRPDRNEKQTDRAARKGVVKQDLVIVSGLIAIAAAIVTVVALARPATTTEQLPYTQSGTLSYTAAVPSGSIYGRDGLQSGQPVYTNLVRRLDLTFSYSLLSTPPARLTGAEQLSVSVDNGQGISRTVLAGRPVRFSGAHFSTTDVLDLGAVQAIAQQFSSEAGGAGGSYTVTVAPVVAVAGRVGPAALGTGFHPQFQFAYGQLALVPVVSTTATPMTPANPASAAGTGSGAGQEGTAVPLVASSQGFLTVRSTKAASLFTNGFTVGEGRTVGLGLLVLSLLVMALAGHGLLRDATSDEEGRRIAARHGGALVEVEALPQVPFATVEVASFDGLLRVARRLECPVLHHVGRRDLYAVVDNGTVYRYSAGWAAEAAGLHASSNNAEHTDNHHVELTSAS